jgi:hypothetical protein
MKSKILKFLNVLVSLDPTEHKEYLEIMTKDSVIQKAYDIIRKDTEKYEPLMK